MASSNNNFRLDTMDMEDELAIDLKPPKYQVTSESMLVDFLPTIKEFKEAVGWDSFDFIEPYTAFLRRYETDNDDWSTFAC